MKNNFQNGSLQFVYEPSEFTKLTEKSTLQYCLGGTLYMPGTRNITGKILSRSMDGLGSMVLCFEDAIEESALPEAENNVIRHLGDVRRAVEDRKLLFSEIPLTFVRVRNPVQFRTFKAKLTKEDAHYLTGFVFPKFHSRNALDYFSTLADLNDYFELVFYGMPILEGPDIALIETRIEELLALKEILEPFRHIVLNIRVGGTDFSAIFGVRRDINSSIYSILTVRDCLSDILNVFGRSADGYTISAPVWEYFLAYKNEDLSNLLAGDMRTSFLNRNTIVNPAVDGLLREVVMDIANGFVGKTIIHPSHLRFVNAMQAVTKETYDDAQQILETKGGVVKSASLNKMNEVSPHKSWAERVVAQAHAYGVVKNEKSYLELMSGLGND